MRNVVVRGLSCRWCCSPTQHDIDSLLRTEGPEAFEALRREARDGMAFCLGVLRDMAPKDAVDWARSFLAQVEMPELFHRFASDLSAGLGLTEGRTARGRAGTQKPA